MTIILALFVCVVKLALDLPFCLFFVAPAVNFVFPGGTAVVPYVDSRLAGSGASALT